MALNSDGIVMAKQKVVRLFRLHNNTEGQSGANLTSMAVSSKAVASKIVTP